MKGKQSLKVDNAQSFSAYQPTWQVNTERSGVCEDRDGDRGGSSAQSTQPCLPGGKAEPVLWAGPSTQGHSACRCCRVLSTVMGMRCSGSSKNTPSAPLAQSPASHTDRQECDYSNTTAF